MALLRNRRIIAVIGFGFAFVSMQLFFLYVRKSPVTRETKFEKQDPTTRYEPTTTTTTTTSLPITNKAATTAPYSWEDAANRFYSRKKHLRDTCNKRTNYSASRWWKKNSNFLVDVPHRLMICAVPKTGTTTWHRTIWALRRKREHLDNDQKLYTYNITAYNQAMVGKVNSREGQILIRHTTADDNFHIDPPLDASFRILLIRHPFARFISGWNQKFMLKSNYWVYLFKTSNNMLNYKKDLNEDHVMSFRDFAAYFVDNVYSGKIDFHFIPAVKMCRPCLYDFTYIVKAESVSIDETWLLRRLNLEDVYAGRKGSPPGGSLVNDNLVENIKKYMKDLSPSLIKRLYLAYKDDFEYFGYTFNFETLEAGGFE